MKKEINTLIKQIYSKINLDKWAFYCEIKKCWNCKKFNEPFLKTKTIKGIKYRVVNPSFLFHLYSTHGIPPMIMLDRYVRDVYNNPDDQEKALEFYEKLLPDELKI